MRFIYLHGFASSPRSTKAAFFSERLTRLGHAVDVPDLEQGDFEGLTITRQLAVVRREIARAPGELTLTDRRWADTSRCSPPPKSRASDDSW